MRKSIEVQILEDQRQGRERAVSLQVKGGTGHSGSAEKSNFWPESGSEISQQVWQALALTVSRSGRVLFTTVVRYFSFFFLLFSEQDKMNMLIWSC